MRLCWLPGVALLLCGCGLGEYEDRMQDAQQRLQRFEQEERFLDGRVQIPSKGEHPIANVFFRPPKGIKSSPVNAKEPLGGILYRYDPQTAGGAGAFNQVELAFGDIRKEFTNDVLIQYPIPPNLTARQISVQEPGQPPQSFQTYEFEDGAYFYSVNIWRGDRSQVAIVFRLDRDRRTSKDVNDTIKASLATLATDAEANARRIEAEKGSPLQAAGRKQ